MKHIGQGKGHLGKCVREITGSFGSTSIGISIFFA